MVVQRSVRAAGGLVPARSRDDARAGFQGLLPHRMLRWRRPAWWQELAIIAFGYWLYSLGRNTIPQQESIAIRHGFSVTHVQDVLHLNVELSVNHFVAAHTWLAQIMDYYYASLHFVVTIAVMLWLFARRAPVYRGARTVLVSTTLIALAGFALYPLAPPRLLPGAGYLDTVAMFHTWGSLASPSIASQSNQFAAMPSLHIGWSLWCAVSLWRCASRLWVRLLAVAYPVATLLVIVGTANHYLLDAAAGAAVVMLAYGLQAMLSGHGAYTPPYDAPDVGLPDPPLPTARRAAAAAR
jgi:PAP2 superfamily